MAHLATIVAMYLRDKSLLDLSCGFIWPNSIGTAPLLLLPQFPAKRCPEGFWLACLVTLGAPDFMVTSNDSNNIMMSVKFISEFY